MILNRTDTYGVSPYGMGRENTPCLYLFYAGDLVCQNAKKHNILCLTKKGGLFSLKNF